MTLILAHKKRKLVRDITVQNNAGSTVVMTTSDVVRIKVGKINQTPLLDLSSLAASANGSTISVNTPSSGYNRVEISQLDMDTLSPGVYSFEVSVVDRDDGNAIKHVDHQIIVVQGTQLGNAGLS